MKRVVSDAVTGYPAGWIATEIAALSASQILAAHAAITVVVREKMSRFLGS